MSFFVFGAEALPRLTLNLTCYCKALASNTCLPTKDTEPADDVTEHFLKSLRGLEKDISKPLSGQHHDLLTNSETQ